MAVGRERSRFETSLIVLAAYHFSKSGFRENPALNVTKLPALWIYQRVKCPSLSTKITLLYSHIACKKWFRNGYPNKVNKVNKANKVFNPIWTSIYVKGSWFRDKSAQSNTWWRRFIMEPNKSWSVISWNIWLLSRKFPSSISSNFPNS